MQIINVEIENYKSFLSSGIIPLTPGFNVIVGQNNAGKTALVEALSLTYGNAPHRSLETAPTAQSQPSGLSGVNIWFRASTEQIAEVCAADGSFYVQAIGGSLLDPQGNSVRKLLRRKEFVIQCHYVGKELKGAWLLGDSRSPDALSTSNQYLKLQAVKSRNGIGISYIGSAQIVDQRHELAWKLAEMLRKRIYFFQAERFNIGDFDVGTETQLRQNAINLASVLHNLYTEKRWLFGELEGFVNDIFPEVTRIDTPPFSKGKTHVRIWTIDPETRREDLAVPLTDSGTGIGQVLSILYVVLTASEPHIFIIDEPQSFLHPGAIRKLFGILKRQEFSQHQFIITTHSPIVASAASPHSLLLVHKEGSESKVNVLDSTKADELHLFLSEVGVRLADVFGADAILWVEGRTEELCFPMILSGLMKKQLHGAVILGVLQTGNFERADPERILRIYRKLCEGRGVLPPAVGFIFDREGRTETKREDLIRESGGTVAFLERRMYENYLLDLSAIASIMSSIEGFRDAPVEVEEIKAWLRAHGWNNEYFKAMDEQERNDAPWNNDFWKRNVHGANILRDMFLSMSENRFPYEKVQHGVMLTRWMIENAPDGLMEVGKLIVDKLSQVDLPDSNT